MAAGFIHDKLEIKFLILYIAARVSEPLPPEGMQELTMCDDGIDYFAYAECLNDLVRTEHLRLTEDGCYAITPKGLKNSEICESSLPYSVRLRTDKNVAEYNRLLLRKNQVQSRVAAQENGSYLVAPAGRCGQHPAPGAHRRHRGHGPGSGGPVPEGPGGHLHPAAVGPVSPG